MAEITEYWMVCQDGWPIQRGLRRQQAEAHASSLKNGLDRHRAGSRVRSVDIEIKRDLEAMQQRNALYVEFKGYRNGGNVTRQQRQW